MFDFRGERRAGTLTPAEAMNQAMQIMETAIAAELDACIMKWATEKLGVGKEEALGILQYLAQKREAREVPSCTLNFDGERVRPDSVRAMAGQLLFNAHNAEVEAILAMLLVKELKQSGEVAAQIIQEFREMRGLEPMDPLEGEGDG
jgi:hypothetical protein